MKKTAVFIAALCLCLSFLCLCLSFDRPPKFHITGSVTGGVEGMKVYLKYADIGWESGNLDSAILHQGHFEFSGVSVSPRFYTILFRDTVKSPTYSYDDKIIDLFVENSEISVQAIYDSLPEEVYGWAEQNKPGAVVVKGSHSNDFFLQYVKEQQALSTSGSHLFEEYIRYLNPGKGAAHQPRSVGITLSSRIDEANRASKSYVMGFISDHVPDEVLAFIAAQAVRRNELSVAEVDSLTGHFDNMPEKGFLVRKFLEEAPDFRRTVIGASLVNTILKDSAGKTYSLSDYVGKGKYVLVECWASWCGPCRADIPHLKEVYGLYHPYGFEIVSVSLDSDREKWLKAMRQEKMAWMQLTDLKAFNGELPKNYHINGIPDCMLFDPEGKLVTKRMRGSWMDRRLMEMYGDHFGGE